MGAQRYVEVHGGMQSGTEVCCGRYAGVCGGIQRFMEGCMEVHKGVQRYTEVCRDAWRYAAVHGGMQKCMEVFRGDSSVYLSKLLALTNFNEKLITSRLIRNAELCGGTWIGV